MIEYSIEKYGVLKKAYKKLAINTIQALELFLEENKISYLSLDYRIKSYESIKEKIERKNYANPDTQIEDFCGIRIICYYQSDVKKIVDLVEKEFEIIESQNKEELLNSDEFGYRSHHLIIKIPESWQNAPNYRNLNELKAELQIRTVLMHAWAEIQHKLAYKKEEHIANKKMARQFSRISAKLEEADEQFEDLRNDATNYQEELKSRASQDDDTFKEIKEINLDNLQAYLDFKYPNRKKTDIARLVDELRELKISFENIEEALSKSENYILNIIENEDHVNFFQSGMIRTALNLSNEKYWNMTHERDMITHPEWIKKMETFREELKDYD